MDQDWRKTRVSNKDVIEIFKKGLRPWYTSFYFSVFSVVIACTAEVIYPVFYKRFFDTLTGGGDPSLLAPILLGIVFTVLITRAIAWAGWRFATFFTSHYQAHAMGKIKTDAFEYILRHSQTFFSHSFVGSLVQRVNRASRALEIIFDSLTWNFLPVLVRITGYTVVLFFVRPLFALIVFVWAALFIGLNYIFAVWKMKYDIMRAEADSRTTGVLADALTNHTTIDFFVAHEKENAHFKEVSDEQTRITRFSWFLGGYIEAVQSALIVVVEFLVFYFGIKLWSVGQISVGTFVLVQTYVIALSNSLWDFGKVVRKFYEAFADAQELTQRFHVRLVELTADLSPPRRLDLWRSRTRSGFVCHKHR